MILGWRMNHFWFSFRKFAPSRPRHRTDRPKAAQRKLRDVASKWKQIKVFYSVYLRMQNHFWDVLDKSQRFICNNMSYFVYPFHGEVCFYIYSVLDISQPLQRILSLPEKAATAGFDQFSTVNIWDFLNLQWWLKLDGPSQSVSCLKLCFLSTEFICPYPQHDSKIRNCNPHFVLWNQLSFSHF